MLATVSRDNFPNDKYAEFSLKVFPHHEAWVRIGREIPLEFRVQQMLYGCHTLCYSKE
jgi:hypothetical protein